MDKLSRIDEVIRQYDDAELEGRTRVPNWAISAFSLEVFESIGYPHRIRLARELWRYHDVMQDNRLDWNLSLIGTSMDSETELIHRSAMAIANFSLGHFGFASAGVDMLSRAAYQFSLISDILKTHQKPWTILEVGPGCGYLGLLLGLSGHRYIALEASQALRTYQSALFNDVFGVEYADGLTQRDGRVSHLSWWDFCAEGSSLPRLTLATANHMLTEMNRMALEHLARKLAASQQVGFQILAEDSGFGKFNDEQLTWMRLASAGFTYKEVRPRVWVFSKTDKPSEIPKPVDPTSLRVKVFEIPLLGSLASRTWRTLRSLTRLVPPPPQKKSSTAVDDQRDVASDVMVKLFASLPNRRGADARFADGSW
jgi:hypothetical protein